MSLYRKKPVVVEAVQWTGQNYSEIEGFTAGRCHLTPGIHSDAQGLLCIHTLESPHEATVGDYIIKGIKGEVYPCKPDIFEATYEPILQPAP